MYEARKLGFNLSADYRLETAEVPVTYYTRAELGDLKGPVVPFAERRQVRLCRISKVACLLAEVQQRGCTAGGLGVAT